MSPRSVKFSLVLLVVVGLGFVYGGWRLIESSRSETCSACGRPVAPRSWTEASVNGHDDVFCCPACVLTLHRQTGQDVRLIRLTDFETGQRIAPEVAYIVVDSRVNLCMRSESHLERDRQAVELEFDRCSPSMLAFSSRTSAESFARQNGGIVKPFQELAVAYRTPTAAAGAGQSP